MQYLRNQWSDCKSSWSSLILTLLWIQRYTMYPLHLNYATTLPRKTITMKITIFHRGFFGNTRIIMTSLKKRNYGRFTLACLFTRMMRTLQGSEGKFISACVTMPPMSHIFIYSRCPSQARLWVRWLFRSTPFSVRLTVVTQRTHRGYSVFSHFCVLSMWLM